MIVVLARSSTKSGVAGTHPGTNHGHNHDVCCLTSWKSQSLYQRRHSTRVAIKAGFFSYAVEAVSLHFSPSSLDFAPKSPTLPTLTTRGRSIWSGDDGGVTSHPKCISWVSLDIKRRGQPGANHDICCWTFRKSEPFYPRHHKSRLPQQGSRSDLYTASIYLFRYIMNKVIHIFFCFLLIAIYLVSCIFVIRHLVIYLKGLDTAGKISGIFYQRDKFCGFLFADQSLQSCRKCCDPYPSHSLNQKKTNIYDTTDNSAWPMRTFPFCS